MRSVILSVGGPGLNLMEIHPAPKRGNVKKRNFCNNTEDHSIDLPRKRISNFTNKNMKEVKKSPKQLATYITRTVGQAVKSPDKLRKVIYRRKKVHHPIQNPCYRKKQPPKSGGCVMANKENELACAGHLPEKLRHDSRTYLINTSDSGSSQTESPSSKYSGFFSEVSHLYKQLFFLIIDFFLPIVY